MQGPRGGHPRDEAERAALFSGLQQFGCRLLPLRAVLPVNRKQVPLSCMSTSPSAFRLSIPARYSDGLPPSRRKVMLTFSPRGQHRLFNTRNAYDAPFEPALLDHFVERLVARRIKRRRWLPMP